MKVSEIASALLGDTETPRTVSARFAYAYKLSLIILELVGLKIYLRIPLMVWEKRTKQSFTYSYVPLAYDLPEQYSTLQYVLYYTEPFKYAVEFSSGIVTGIFQEKKRVIPLLRA